MKKAISVLAVSLTVIIPTIINAEQSPAVSETQQKISASETDNETQIMVIVNHPAEESPSNDEQLESSDATDESSQQELSSAGDTAEIAEPAEPTFDIPITLNEEVEMYIHYFTNRMRDKFSTWLARSEMYLPMMKKTFKEKGLPEDLTYLALIESGFNNKAYSRAKAAGQWQFIKGTGKRYGLRIDRWIDERRDPEKATVAAAEYLSDLFGMFNDWHLAAAGYNAGEGKILRAINKYDTNDFWQLSQPKYKYLKKETKHYVPKLIAAAMIAKEPEKYGFDIEYHPTLTYETVVINRMMDLRDVAEAAECSVDDMQHLNPELKTKFTPPNYPNYELNVPMGAKALLEERIASIKTVSEKAAFKEVGPEKTSFKKKKRTKRMHKRVASKKIIS